MRFTKIFELRGVRPGQGGTAAAAASEEHSVAAVALLVREDGRAELRYFRCDNAERITALRPGVYPLFLNPDIVWLQGLNDAHIIDAAMSRNGRYLLLVSSNKIFYYNLSSGQLILPIEGPSIVQKLQVLCVENIREDEASIRQKAAYLPHSLGCNFGFLRYSSKDLPEGFKPTCCAIDEAGNGILGGEDGLMACAAAGATLSAINRCDAVYACSYNSYDNVWAFMTKSCVLTLTRDPALTTIWTNFGALQQEYHYPELDNLAHHCAVGVFKDYLIMSFQGQLQVLKRSVGKLAQQIWGKALRVSCINVYPDGAVDLACITSYGSENQIIRPGILGFHIDPSRSELTLHKEFGKNIYPNQTAFEQFTRGSFCDLKKPYVQNSVLSIRDKNFSYILFTGNVAGWDEPFDSSDHSIRFTAIKRYSRMRARKILITFKLSFD
jgi:hypothetical protein